MADARGMVETFCGTIPQFAGFSTAPRTVPIWWGKRFRFGGRLFLKSG